MRSLTLFKLECTDSVPRDSSSVSTRKMPKNRFSELMHFACVRYGYCGGLVDGKFLHVTDFIPENGDVSASEFAEWVMLADGCTPESSARHYQRHKTVMELAFIKYMGAEVVPAQELRRDAEW
jgi:hypothetical protein